MKRSAIIFGASLAGRRTYEYYNDRYRILAFADNDPKKHSTRLLGLPVIAPRELATASFDCVLIGSAYCGPITKQLLAQGIPPECIGWVNMRILEGAFEGIARFRLGWRIARWAAGLVGALALGWVLAGFLRE